MPQQTSLFRDEILGNISRLDTALLRHSWLGFQTAIVLNALVVIAKYSKQSVGHSRLVIGIWDCITTGLVDAAAAASEQTKELCEIQPTGVRRNKYCAAVSWLFKHVAWTTGRDHHLTLRNCNSK